MKWTILAVMLAIMLPGCASSLSKVERNHGLATVEKANGISGQGDFDQRQNQLDSIQIVNQEVQMIPTQGLKCLIDNTFNHFVRVEIRRHSFWGNNPVIVSVDFHGHGSQEVYLMPGKVDVTISCGITLDSKTYEVTPAPQWDDKAGKWYHLVIPVVYVPYSLLSQYRHY
ncbi:MAG TPA: hypothetical protein VMD74_01920 [Candidatus Methylomirabilis sp.]|nr:hypothetical protein [Candidatus Methylomirabilis sp.]